MATADGSAVADDKIHAPEVEATSLEEAEKTYVFFWKNMDPFSQWHKSSFSVDGQVYNCAEQYMMHQKAVLFGDEDAAKRVLATDSPRLQKKIGRQVKNWDDDLWDRSRVGIVKKGNRAKFSQNPKLKSVLLSTHPKILVEASPLDQIWGIGCAKEDSAAWNRATWRGKNLLGFALTDVREELMREEGLVQEPIDLEMARTENSGNTTTDLGNRDSMTADVTPEKKTTGSGGDGGKEEFEFFFGKNSPFSQHHPVTFEIDGLTYNCAEQYMMHQKAVVFKDDEMAEQIMATSNPVEQKRRGRRVQNFVKEVWDTEAPKVVKRANLAKFSQNEDLRKKLLATFPRTLAEASPRDTLWGIGMGASNPKARDRKLWRGKNLLGNILTEVRDELMAEETST